MTADSYKRIIEALFLLAAFLFTLITANKYRDSVEYPRIHTYAVKDVFNTGLQMMMPAGSFGTELLELKNYRVRRIQELFGGSKSNTEEEQSVRMTTVQFAKYAGMCYGNREDGHLILADHSDTICGVNSDTLRTSNPWHISNEDVSGNVKKYPWVRSLLLEKWQLESESKKGSYYFEDRSFCTCMDQMYQVHSHTNAQAAKQRMKSDIDAFFIAYEAQVTKDAKDKTLYDFFVMHYLQSHSSFDMTIYNDVLAYASASRSIFNLLNATLDGNLTNQLPVLNIQDPQGIEWKKLADALKHVVDHMRVANIEKEYLAEPEKFAEEFEQLNFCMRYSIPKYTMQYTGSMDSWRYVYFGQILLLVSCLYSIQLYRDSNTDEENNALYTQPTGKDDVDNVTGSGDTIDAKISNKQTAEQWIPQLARIGFIVAILIMTFVDISDEDINKTERFSSSDSDMNNNLKTVFNFVRSYDWFLILTACVILVLVLCFEVYVIWPRSKNTKTLTKRLLFIVMQDVVNILALGSISVGSSLQTGVREVTCILTIAALTISIAFAQHISNVMSVLFDCLFSRYDNSETSDKDQQEKKNTVMLHICYVRAGIILSIVVTFIFLLTRTGITTTHTEYSDSKVMSHVLFSILFLVLLCGFDLFYELFNFNMESLTKMTLKSEDKRWMHNLIVIAYVFFSNFVYIRGFN